MRRLGWLMFGATCVCAVAQGIALFGSGAPFWSYDVLIDQGFPLLAIGSVLGAAIGALIISRYPRNVIGWLFAAGQLGDAVGLACKAVVFSLTAAGRPDSIPRAVLFGSQLFGAFFTITFLSLIYLLAPEGRLLSPRWRYAVIVPIGALLAQIVVLLTFPPAVFLGEEPTEMSTLSVAVLITSTVAMGVAIGLGAMAVWRRLRLATGERRQQLLWVAASGAAMTVTYALLVGVQLTVGAAPWYSVLPIYLAYIFVSVSIGIAILRYRLYDIDLILSRAIVLATLGVFVTVGYIAVVVTIGWALSAFGASGADLYWPSLVASALVAAAFQPLRRGVLRWTDRLVYGPRATPYEALAELNQELVNRPSPAAVPAMVAEIAGRAVGAVRAVATVGPADDPLVTSTWTRPKARPAARSVEHAATVTDLGETIGCVSVEVPAGRGLRPFERVLLDDIGRQAGVAFRGARLEAEVAERVAQVESSSAELERSRRRLVRAEDEARERFAADIDERVVPLLTTVRDGLTGADGPDRLAGAINGVEAALEELRTVVRGVFPALLERRGLAPALFAAFERLPDIDLEVDGLPDGRLDRDVEAAAYLFCVDVAPRDRPGTVRLAVVDGSLTAEVTGSDGSPDRWLHVRDRLAASDGALSVDDGIVRAVIPVR
jgi:signal transduction histidine kinase